MAERSSIVVVAGGLVVLQGSNSAIENHRSASTMKIETATKTTLVLKGKIGKDGRLTIPTKVRGNYNLDSEATITVEFPKTE